MKLSIQLFAAAKDAVGSSALELQLADASTVADLRKELVVAAPKLKTLAPTLLIAVDQEYAADNTVLATTQQIACFPPVSGG